MENMVFINLPTKNVAAARDFYSGLGFKINEEFSSDDNVFVVLNDSTQLILLTEDFLRQHGEKREFADATKVMETSLAVTVGSREKVDTVADAALAAGGKDAGKTEEPEMGIYARAFFDLDGHKIDINHMSM
ncbi:MAG TPA: VOC family protein [Candidatus Saccharimonadales bacterium]|nr:VOC family protein [Candidatus Saccharimonadales bacterium]